MNFQAQSSPLCLCVFLLVLSSLLMSTTLAFTRANSLFFFSSSSFSYSSDRNAHQNFTARSCSLGFHSHCNIPSSFILSFEKSIDLIHLACVFALFLSPSLSLSLSHFGFILLSYVACSHPFCLSDLVGTITIKTPSIT